jgi:hypothetical protein
MQSRKETAWKKSRKFGDIKGGRTSIRLTDRIFARTHSLQTPSADRELPIFIVDNPSRNFFFPIDVDDIRHELARLPHDDWCDITHIWLRRFKQTEYESDELPLAEFSCGSGVHLITLYPWPVTLEWNHGHQKPSLSRQRVLERYDAELSLRDDTWISHWQQPKLKDFYIEYLLFHEIGHHVDWYSRHWSKANNKIMEEAADRYAFRMTTKRSATYTAE